MQKHALKVDMGTVGRFGLGGLIGGAGTASLLDLIHMLREQRKEQLDIGKEQDTDKDTIVVHLPPKGAEVLSKCAYMLKHVPMVSSKATKVDKKTKAGGRKPSGHRGGQFDNPVKVTDSEGAPESPDVTKSAAGWPTLTLGSLAALGGAGAGAALVDKLYAMRRERMLKKELEAAQQEYVKTLAGKTASVMDELFPLAMDKQAHAGDEHTFGLLNYPLAAAAILTLMGTGGTAYITKKILDEKLMEAHKKGLELPEVKRIVFKSSPASAPADVPPDMKQASAQDMMNIKAALFIMMDKLDTHTRVLGTPGVKEAQAAAGLSTNKLFDLSEENINEIMEALNKNPALAKAIVRQGMAKRPIMKHFQWAANTTPGMALGKRGIRSFLEDHFGGAQAETTKMKMKTANFTDTAAAMVLGKTLGSVAGNASKSLLKPDASDDSDQDEQSKQKTDVRKVKVTAADPRAAEYLEHNKQKVLKVLEHMSAEGKI